MKEPRDPWGQPVPPYTIELMVTSLGVGRADEAAADGRAAAVAARARVKSVASTMMKGLIVRGNQFERVLEMM